MIVQFREFLINRENSRSFWAAIWYGGGTFIERALSFIFVFIFASVLTTEEYGAVSIFLTWIAVFLPILTLNVSASIQRAEFDFSVDQRASYISSVLMLGALGPLVGLTIVTLIPATIVQQIFGLDAFEIQLAVVSAASLSAINGTFLSWRVQHLYERYTVVSIGYTLSRLLMSLAAIFLIADLVAGDGGSARMLGITTVDLLLGGYLTVVWIVRGKSLYNAQAWYYALSYSVPLIPHTIAGVLLAQFDRVMIAQFVGPNEAGIYSYAYQMGEVVRYVWLATNAAWIPWLFGQLEKGSVGIIRQRSKQYIAGFTLITALAILVVPIGVRLITPIEYQQGVSIIPLIMAGGHATFLYSLYAAIEFYDKKTWYISVGTIFSAVVNVVLNWLLLPRFGYQIAAWITVSAYVCMLVFNLVIVVRILRKGNLVPTVWVVVSGGMIIILMLLSYFLS